MHMFSDHGDSRKVSSSRATPCSPTRRQNGIESTRHVLWQQWRLSAYKPAMMITGLADRREKLPGTKYYWFKSQNERSSFFFFANIRNWHGGCNPSCLYETCPGVHELFRRGDLRTLHYRARDAALPSISHSRNAKGNGVHRSS